LKIICREKDDFARIAARNFRDLLARDSKNEVEGNG